MKNQDEMKTSPYIWVKLNRIFASSSSVGCQNFYPIFILLKCVAIVNIVPLCVYTINITHILNSTLPILNHFFFFFSFIVDWKTVLTHKIWPKMQTFLSLYEFEMHLSQPNRNQSEFAIWIVWEQLCIEFWMDYHHYYRFYEIAILFE